MDREQFRELCAAYVLDALDDDERREVDRVLAEGDPELQQIYAEMQETALHLPMVAPRATPPAHIKARILEAVRTRSQEQYGSVWDRLSAYLGFRNPGFALGFSFAMVLVALGISWYATTLRTTVRQQQQQLVALQDELTASQALLRVLEARTVEMVIMNGQAAHPGGYGKIIWDPERKIAILQIAGLPPAPTDKDYQLWVIRDQTPLNAGVFSIRRPDQERFFRIDNLVETNRETIDAFAVTLEPLGGVPQPTGPMYLLGS